MNGTYYIYEDGVKVAESRNLITDAGKEVILQFLAGDRNGMGEYMAFGIGEGVPAVTDLSLDFEYHRSEVDLKQPEFIASRLVFRATIPDQKTFEVHEIGLYLDDDTMDEENPNTVITTFDSRDEVDWEQFDGVTYTPASEVPGGRTGTASFQLDVPASTTYSLVRNGVFGAFGGLAAGDEFAIAFETLTGAADTIEVRFRVDESNYRSYQFVPAAGFQTHRWKKSDFTEVGVAGWDDFTSLEIVVAAGASGADVIFEGLRFDNVTNNERPVLVSRTLLGTSIQKRGTAELQIEYILNVGFSA